jgi:hypothetical protein
MYTCFFNYFHIAQSSGKSNSRSTTQEVPSNLWKPIVLTLFAELISVLNESTPQSFIIFIQYPLYYESPINIYIYLIASFLRALLQNKALTSFLIAIGT